MTIARRGLLLTLLSVPFASLQLGHADDDVDDLSRVVENEDLDSYWADARTWLEYGYRPQVTVPLSRFDSAGFPSYFAGKDAYSFGPGTPPPTSISNPLEKSDVQLTKYGTWH